MRYERKYRIDNLHWNGIIQSIRLHPASFRKIYPDRQINNIYFDTIDFKTYRENVMGLGVRNKYRLRWYGYDVHQIQKPKLEIKHRHNETGTKTIFDVSPFQLTNLQPITKEVNRLAYPYCEANLQPMLLSSYVRAYFGSADGKFRVTVDKDLRYHGWKTGANFQTYNIYEEGIHILEVKYDAAIDDTIDYVTQFFPFRRTKNSKYVNGIDMCYM